MPEVLENKIEECINLLKRGQVIQNIDCPLPEGFQLRELEANDFERGTVLLRTSFIIQDI